jgi:hypothetical protein
VRVGSENIDFLWMGVASIVCIDFLACEL